MRTLARSFLVLCLAGATFPAAAKDLAEYFQPTPIVGKLTTNTWGVASTLPRDINNGLEDPANKWLYWDSAILRAKDGKYHMFASRWPESLGHGGWAKSVIVHAVSDTATGPYIDKGLAFTDHDGLGCNIAAVTLPDGRYALLLSETRPGSVYISSSLDGPWEYQGDVKIDDNGFKTSWMRSNMGLMVRPDGSFLSVARRGFMMLSTNGVMGTYKVQGQSIWPTMEGLNNEHAEDPVIWYSGGQYHITVNWWSSRKAYHLASPDGITNWTNMGLAYDPKTDFIRYTDGTVNHWNKIERPAVVIENGHVTQFSFAVLDVEKGQEKGNDNHGSKVIVVPFDGKAFDADMASAAAASQPKPGDADFPQPSPCGRHSQKVAAIKTNHFDLALIGDSITEMLEREDGECKPLKEAVWKKYYAPRNAINLGYSGYRTENILWNLQNGELDFAQSPKVAILLIGTNNTDDQHYGSVHTGEQLFAGIKAIVELIRQRHPTTKIIIRRPFPCGVAGDQTSFHRKYNRSLKAMAELNKGADLASKLADDKQVFWSDVNKVFLTPDGKIDPALMPDLIHPNAAGAEAAAVALEPLLSKLMGPAPAPAADAKAR